ncbi:ABC transporter substrate-binding protein [Synechococcus sp. PCC 7336]|uniref:ABC transporter substrate-binding protein n=1 Tax=Synechococcus sp. PCC 7336 TaxID=195250 RepID=UPI000346F317|nr:ABC transporter substrate-binding protein [Synechococcus sp. PCC 7336]
MTAASLRAGFCAALLGLLLFSVSCGDRPPATSSVSIMGSITGEGEATIAEVFAPFTAATGIEVTYEGTDQFATLLTARIAAGNPPDIALFPQPGLMSDLARSDRLVPLDRFLTPAQLNAAYTSHWLEQAAVKGQVYGLWARASLKSLVWYSPPAFEAAGYEVPHTWGQLQQLSDRIVADGGVPWCLGLESGAATGWVGTDWVEEFLLREAGPEVYDRWVAHDIPFSDPAVRQAFESFGELVLDGDRVLGGPIGALSTPFGDSPVALFERPPGCYLHRQASFIATFFPDRVEPGRDVSLFLLPGINPDFGNPVLVSGELFGLLNDTPAARALMEYFTRVEPHTLWAAAEGFVSPHRQVALDTYANPNTRRQAEILARAEVLRFDGSDLMPGAVGTGSFWSGVTDYIGGTNLETVLAEIDASWPDE